MIFRIPTFILRFFSARSNQRARDRFSFVIVLVGIGAAGFSFAAVNEPAGRPEASESASFEAGIPSPLSGPSTASPDTTPQFRGISRRALARMSGAGTDTTTYFTPSDTTHRLSLLPRDSTARLAQFLFHREDVPVVSLFQRHTYSMFLKPPPVIMRTVELDSTGQYVIIRETVDGKDVKIPLKMPLKEYIEKRFLFDEQQYFEDQVYKYEGLKKKDELGALLGSFTNIDIPIPANPVFSIFGPPKINLHISGAVDITAAFRNTTTDQSTLSLLGNSRNEPDFKQDVQINISGTIGDKLNILADWNTQRTFEYENQLHIKYTGYDDEIIQSVEAGNVSLPSNSQFISPSAALFGIKTLMQFGPLKLVSIASQKKGQIKDLTVSGGTSTQQFAIHAYQYSHDHYFLDTSYIPLFEAYYGNTLRPTDARKHISDCEVYVTHQSLDPQNSIQAVAWINLPAMGDSAVYQKLRDPNFPGTPEANTMTQNGGLETGRWDKLVAGQDYTLHDNTGYISLNRSVSDDQAIAVAYRVDNGAGTADDSIYGVLTSVKASADSIFVLKLIRPRSLLPKDTVAWKLMLKNIYSLGGRNIKPDGFQLKITYGLPGQTPSEEIDGKNLLYIFGFDNYLADNSPGQDTKFDYLPGITVDEASGEIIFPSTEPFVKSLKQYFAGTNHPAMADSFTYPDIYDTTQIAAQYNNSRDRFLITGQTTAGVSNTYNLGFNIVEGSVQVILNGNPLKLNVDYTVDYITGQVIIKNQAALVPGANLEIKYEQNDLFQLASKTLLGTRGDLNFSDKTGFGFTIMNLNQQTLSDKVRLGEEPTNNTIFGVDGHTAFALPILTKALDALPFVSTRAPSNISVRGEAAYMSPNPNTKASLITSDGGKGVAYIDDFEGAKRTIPLGVGYGQWHDLSVPAYIDGVDPINGTPIPDTTKMFSKAKTYWYNVLPSDIKVTDIWPLKQAATDQQQVTVMNILYDPRTRGEYNYSLNLSHNFGAKAPADTVKQNWGGMMKLVSSGKVDLVEENIGYIELWVAENPAVLDSTKKMYIDLGEISEDVIPNRKLDTEEGLVHTGVVTAERDKGLDGLTDAEESSVYSQFVTANRDAFPEVVGDPSGDDYQPANLNTGDFRFVNGTEGNRNSEIGRFPDTEDLNGNYNVDLNNSYFEYEVNLDTSVANPQRVGGGHKDDTPEHLAWYQYKIPITEFKRKVGSPDLSLIEYVRVWFKGFDKPQLLRITEFNLVGNQWEVRKRTPSDSTLSVGVVSIEDNPNTYTSPPGVNRAVDRTQSTQSSQTILQNEQSLSLSVNGLQDGDNRQVIRRFSYKPLDLFSYRQMRMFVHGDEGPPFSAHKRFSDDPNNADAVLFVRFGADSLNYYEYREPVLPGWHQNNTIIITFSDLTAIKQRRDSVNQVLPPVPVPGGPPGSTYNVLGNPALTNVAFISVGVYNPPGEGVQNLTGDIWIDELRLADPDATPGWAYSFSSQIALADIGSFSFNYQQTNPFFHQLENQFGNRVNGTSWGMSTNFSLEKFLPATWTGTTLQFSYSHQEASSKPLYLPSSDIVVTQAADQERQRVTGETGSAAAGNAAADDLIVQSQSLSTSDTYALPTIKFVFPSNNWLVRDIVNQLTYGFNYTISTMRDPATTYRESWSWATRLSYAYQVSPNLYVAPFSFFGTSSALSDLKEFHLYYIPITNFGLNFSASRSQTHQHLRSQLLASAPTRGFNAQRSMTFGWKLTEGGYVNLSGDYSVDIASTLVQLETDQLGRQRAFTDIVGDMFLRDQFINFGRDNSYNQNINVNMRPRVPGFLGMDKYLTLSSHYSVSYRWTNNLQQGDLGKGASWANNISFSTDISLKSFVDTWFPTLPSSSSSENAPLPQPQGGFQQQPQFPQPPGVPRGGRRGEGANPSQPSDTTHHPPSDTTHGAMSDTAKRVQPNDTAAVVPKKKISPKEALIRIARLFIKTPLLDYDKVSFAFSQTNSSSNPGVPGRPGFANLFGRVPLFQSADPAYGSTRAYQLGLVSDPTSNITSVQFKSSFPFIGFSVDHGVRAAAANFSDVFSQSNKISFSTSRELWTGARMDLKWNLGWDYSRSQSVTTDARGVPTINSLQTGGSINRSFFTLPPVFIFSIFKSGIAQVGKDYDQLKSDVADTRSNDQKLAQAFEDGFETFPLLRKIFGDYFPRVNYTFHWDGLEQYTFFEKWAQRVSLDHAYNSTYTTSFKGDLVVGGQNIQAQRIMYGFAPLVGLNITFKEMFKGNMSANIQYSTNSTFDLTPAAQNIIQGSTREISLTATYGRTGFQIPLFGISLSNDVDISFTYSLSQNSRTTYDARQGIGTGVPGEGSTRTTMEPRIRYVLSSRVTASVYYRYTSIVPDAGGSSIPGSTTNEGGLDVHISIQ
ncbi:MAG: cell surface protein SprA [Bacteroidota bacterium]|nr:cell surface protein SprA [Bacteroidota bacterium]